ncbi:MULTISPECIES: S26 family signal peptidase [unclassified Corallococcus]|uniref:S26 family signal peptidase n=1 Tax=unclassified Corallococcus TaxID=2685029 RepID=UPI001A8EC7EA|nr:MULTISPECIES: S26 family signal peptidase [unclassified Corallococcus]MBN9685363.1 S26 family signal peptidase [Corallococcus sp. NCSPR001]WAS89435.1 S26 family signal peptidase [Corallococcus sp. NCRR]
MLSAMGVGAGLLVAGAALTAWARRRWLVITVRGNSMSPTLRDGQQLLARRRAGDGGYARSDVIVFMQPAERLAVMNAEDPPYLIKRVAAVAGDPVPDWAWPKIGADSQTRVPPGKVVVSGDNAENTQDSRQLGYIDAEAIIGVVRVPGS